MVVPPLDLEPPLDLVVVDLVDDLGGLQVERERVVLVDLVVGVVGVVVLVLLVLLGELVLVSRVVVIVPSLFRTDRVFVVVVLEEVLVGRLVLQVLLVLLDVFRLAFERVLETVLKALRLAKLVVRQLEVLFLEFLYPLI